MSTSFYSTSTSTTSTTNQSPPTTPTIVTTYPITLSILLLLWVTYLILPKGLRRYAFRAQPRRYAYSDDPGTVFGRIGVVSSNRNHYNVWNNPSSSSTLFSERLHRRETEGRGGTKSGSSSWGDSIGGVTGIGNIGDTGEEEDTRYYYETTDDEDEESSCHPSLADSSDFSYDDSTLGGVMGTEGAGGGMAVGHNYGFHNARQHKQLQQQQQKREQEWERRRRLKNLSKHTNDNDNTNPPSDESGILSNRHPPSDESGIISNRHPPSDESGILSNRHTPSDESGILSNRQSSDTSNNSNANTSVIASDYAVASSSSAAATAVESDDAVASTTDTNRNTVLPPPDPAFVCRTPGPPTQLRKRILDSIGSARELKTFVPLQSSSPLSSLLGNKKGGDASSPSSSSPLRTIEKNDDGKDPYDTKGVDGSDTSLVTVNQSSSDVSDGTATNGGTTTTTTTTTASNVPSDATVDATTASSSLNGTSSMGTVDGNWAFTTVSSFASSSFPSSDGCTDPTSLTNASSMDSVMAVSSDFSTAATITSTNDDNNKNESSPRDQTLPSMHHPDPHSTHIPPLPTLFRTTLHSLTHSGILLTAYGLRCRPRTVRLIVDLEREVLLWRTEMMSSSPSQLPQPTPQPNVLPLCTLLYIDVDRTTAALRLLPPSHSPTATATTSSQHLSSTNGCWYLSVLTNRGSLDLGAKSQTERDAIVSCFCWILDGVEGGRWRQWAVGLGRQRDDDNDNGRNEEGGDDDNEGGEVVEKGDVEDGIEERITKSRVEDAVPKERPVSLGGIVEI